MSDYIVKDTELTSVANAIRIKGGTNSQLVFPNGFVSAIGNISGGGTSWQTAFEGSVTTEETPRGNIAQREGYYISADNIKVTFNGTEYECPKISVESANIYGGFNESTQTPDFSEYPFSIMSASEGGDVFFNFYTESTGTYTIKIEEPQSGGSSDFSTAQVTIVGDSIYITMPLVTYDPESPVGYFLNSQGDSQVLTPNTYTTVLYKGYLLCRMSFDRAASVSLSGGCEWVSEENKTLLITGDCTITIS